MADADHADIARREAAAAFNATTVALATLDPDGRVIIANAAFAAMIGVPADRVAGVDWLAFIQPNDRTQARAGLAAVGESSFDVRLVPHAEGMAAAHVACVMTSMGISSRRTLAMRDVAGRRRDERERQQFKFMADLAGDAYFLVDEQSRIVYANRVAHVERGYGPGELIGLPVDAVNPNYDAARVRKLFENTCDGTSLRLTHAHLRRDGTTFPVESGVNCLTLDGRRFLFSAVRDMTVQREAETAIRRERERMAMVVKQANVGIWYAPFPLGALIWDEKVREHFFMSPDEPVTLDRCFAGIHPDDREATRIAFARCIDEGIQYDIVYRTIALDGSGRSNSIRAIGRCHFDEAGKPTQVDGVTVDVSREVRDAIALRESESRFRQMANHAPVMVWVTEPDGYCSFLNDRWYAFTGQKTEEALGLGWADATHPDDADMARDAFMAANERRSHFEIEYRLRRHDGVYRWCIDSAAPRFGPGGEFLGYIGSVIDITDRKLVEERLRESEQRLQLAVAIAQLGTFEIDLATDVVIVNEAGRDIYAWDAKVQPTFTMIRSARHPDDQARVTAAVDEAIRPGGPGRYEVEQRIRRTTGEQRWIRVRGLAIFGNGPDRPATRLVGTFLDVTEQKAADERRERLIKAEHDARVQAEVARAASEKARVESERARGESERARAEAESAARLRDEFLTTLSHELRTPLNAILGWATLLRRGDKSKDPGVGRGLETIERNARAQAQVISDLLDVRHIISGNLRLDIADVDLADAARDALAGVRAAADAKQLHVDLRGLDEPAPLRGDSARLRQIAWNLLSNAVKFTPQGGNVRIEIRRPSFGQVELRVADDGQGIEADFLPRVFERFRMADASSTRRHGGLGLGLAIVKSLVELHGGSVTADSPGPGAGATFVVTLPVVSAAGSPGGPVGASGRPTSSPAVTDRTEPPTAI